MPAQSLLAPRRLSPEQCYILENLIERDGKARSEALFALGYWAGCRVSDVSWFRTDDVHVGPKVGWIRVGHKGGKKRDIDLLNEARRPLREYLDHGGRDPESPYILTSQRAPRLTEAGVHHWLRTLKKKATKDEWELISDVTFHDLRHDFAHRAREAGWTVEEVAYYLGHTTKKGTPAIQTTVRLHEELGKVSRLLGSGKLPGVRLENGELKISRLKKEEPESISIKTGTVTASLILKKLANYPRQNGLAKALREIGRIERTLFELEWYQDMELRRRGNAGLNKGEAHNALARAVYFNRLGELRDRSYEDQQGRASGLALLCAAIGCGTPLISTAWSKSFERGPANIVATQPRKNGVIADFEVTEKMLAHFIRGAQPKRSILRYLVQPARRRVQWSWIWAGAPPRWR